MTNKIGRLSGALLFLSLFFPLNSMAVPVTRTMVEQAGQTHIWAQNQVERFDQARRGITYYPDRSIASIDELKNSQGTTLAYVLTLSPIGYVVISVDTDITPIIAQSHDNKFVWEDCPENALLHMVYWDMENRLKALPITSTTEKQNNNMRWNNYVAADSSFVAQITRATAYGPLLPTPTWNQDSPYNTYCPIDPTTGQRSYTGCVATSMAQIINYFKWPGSVTFTASDNYTTKKNQISITASTANITGITYPASPDMAARLSYACGVSVFMDYTSSGSNAYISDMPSALKNKFGYVSANYISPLDATAYPTIQSNVKNRQPVNLGIDDGKGKIGHSIVCDGYNGSTGQYHLNYGWGGSANGWYSLPSGMPAGYSVVDEAVTDIKPSSTPTPTANYNFVWAGTGGSASIWTLNGSNTPTTGCTIYGPYAGWTPVSYTYNPSDGTRTLLWAGTGGSASIWTLNSSNIPTTGCVIYGPYAGWRPVSYTYNPSDGTRTLLWAGTGGSVSIWTLNSSNIQTTNCIIYGPYSGWTPVSYIYNPSDVSKRTLLWAGASGSASIWNLNCAALTESLLEAELFGYVKGAFTGAATDRPGRLEAAAGGTLFLDEIAHMSLPLQAKLLRFLQERTFEPVGSSTSRHVDIRLITASNSALQDLIKAGKFLADLLYRIEVITLRLPPLRERKEDLPHLVVCFIRHYSEQYNKSVEGVRPEAMEVLLDYPWPGNVREMKNCLARAVILAKGPNLAVDDLSEKILARLTQPRPAGAQGVIEKLPEQGVRLQDMELDLINKTLQKCAGNKSRAAKLLGISRKALYQKIERFQLPSSSDDHADEQT
ncbi:MAG: sigma 54-interacting transcriptional regulator [Deltaproteobacteria bacterium]|nr:sigma 54-interacting transcriptional regulator [Deltaproteobacteria bacterium]